MKSSAIISFVIPARNEAEHIGAVIESIHRFAGPSSREIIVVDNGSTDDTPALARAHGAEVLSFPGVTVAELRNQGAARSHGEVLVFLDGDVLLTEGWRDSLPNVLDELRVHPDTVTGSRCGISRRGSWIENTWFKPLLTEQPNYINSGHLITTRKLFQQVNGFDARLETGEDSDFSQRARALGARIVNNPALEVIHEGYPKTLGRFIRREMWHGRGNFQSLRQVMKSRIAPMTILFLALHVGTLFSLWTGWGVPAIPILCVIGVVALCSLASMLKYRRPFSTVLFNCYLYYWYFFARSLSLLAILTAKPLRLLTRDSSAPATRT